MNKPLLSILSGAIGLAIGAVGTYIFLNKKYEDDYYWKLREAIDEECERLRSKHSEILERSSSEEGDVKIFDEPDKNIETPEENSYHERIDELGKAFLEGVDSALKQEDLSMMDISEEIQTPHFIEEDEFRFLPPKYEIRELQYFAKDGTVLDINDEIVNDPQIYISGLEEKLKKIQHYETVYILVESIGVACEVVVLQVSYNDIL